MEMGTDLIKPADQYMLAIWAISSQNSKLFIFQHQKEMQKTHIQEKITTKYLLVQGSATCGSGPACASYCPVAAPQQN